MSYNILLTGVGLGAKFFQKEVPSNMDFFTLVANPQILLWANKIILSPEAVNYISYIENLKEKNEFHIIIEKIYEVCDKTNLFEFKNYDNENDTKNLKIIRKRVGNEIEQIKKSEILDLQRSELPGGVKIGCTDYCLPKILSFHTSIYFANKWGAQIIANREFTNYFRASNNKYLSNINRNHHEIKALDKILSWKLPKLPFSCFGNKDKCKYCKHYESSLISKHKEFDQFLYSYLNFRGFDEILQIRNIVTEITQDIEYEDISVKEIIAKYKEKEINVRKANAKLVKYTNATSNVLFGASLCIPVLANIIPQIQSLDSAVIANTALGAATMAGVVDRIKEKIKIRKNWVYFKIDN